MHPVVSQFLSLLIEFAERGPIFVSGKITLIYKGVQDLSSGYADGGLLVEVAEQCRNLLEHVRNTGTNIRDLMNAIKDEATTAMYVERFFKDYVVRIFIGDYHEMRTQEHPLSRRPEIISATERLHTSDEQRERLIGWYESKMFGGDRQKAEARFERDIQRILDLRRIDEYLTRLDDEIRRANKRAMAVVDYRLRALRPIDHLVERAIDAILTGTTLELCNPFPRGSLLGEFGLAEPRKRVPRPPSAPLRKQIPSDEDVARAQLMLKANDARTVTPIRLANYVLKHLGDADSVRSESLTVTSIEDARALQTLWSIGVGMSSGNRQLQYAALGMAKGFRVRLDDEGDSLHTCITGRPFTIERSLRKPSSQKGA